MNICYSDVVIDCTYQVLYVYHHFLFLKIYGVQSDSYNMHDFLISTRYQCGCSKNTSIVITRIDIHLIFISCLHIVVLYVITLN